MEHMEQPPARRRRRYVRPGEGLAIGIALGVALGGIVFNNLATGITIGAGIGVVLDEIMTRRNRPGQ